MTESDNRSANRQVAYKVRVSDLLSGRYVKEDGWLPNYVVVGDMNVSRANIIGVIVSKDDEGMVLDDGSGSMPLRFFDSAATVGQVVNVFGRPREFGSERYIVPEIIRKIDDPRWVELRKLELARQKFVPPPQPSPPAAVDEPETEEIEDDNPSSLVYRTIKSEDSGTGVGFDEIIVKTRLDDINAPIKRLLEQGDIFEIKPGRYKVLE